MVCAGICTCLAHRPLDAAQLQTTAAARPNQWPSCTRVENFHGLKRDSYVVRGFPHKVQGYRSHLHQVGRRIRINCCLTSWLIILVFTDTWYGPILSVAAVFFDVPFEGTSLQNWHNSWQLLLLVELWIRGLLQ